MILAGTNIYLRKLRGSTFTVKPDTDILDDDFLVAYDVRINGETVIPRGTKMMGNWINTTTPTVTIELQITKVHYDNMWLPFHAASDVIYAIAKPNNVESHLNKVLAACSNMSELYDPLCKVTIELIEDRDELVMNVSMNEIRVVMSEDFDLC